ncbi:L-fucose/L-arabinose isomerase family protein [Jannaschia sp. 2305UL9-9]|uniref:L-fucose/L-arabinose isomerase family protein n=1 Tax=Jannaschia sp. 2305UL9-9 TaxID=3121638 RepID=UPI0035294B44
MRVGILPLARPTFDVAFAEEKLAAMLAQLDASGHEVIGPRALLMQADEEALAAVAPADVLLILQVTFTDAAFATRAAVGFGGPVAVWAVPEPRTGGRLRLNAFCGLNLLSHALGLNDRPFTWAYGDAIDLEALLSGDPVAPRRGAPSTAAATPIRRDLSIARIGARPDGFDTCDYDRAALKDLIGAKVTELELPDLFDRARDLPSADVIPYAAKAAQLGGIDTLDEGELDRSLRLAGALDQLRAEHRFDAMAIRCWPETFTEYGGAVCGPVSMLGEARTPCACEADVYGAVTQAILQDVADAPVFLADLVDMDDDTGVVWHCGQAPASMAAKAPDATVHTNRKQALLLEFPLKPGRITLFRLSQAYGRPQIVIATGEVLDRPMAFTGTSGVVRFDHGAGAVCADVMATGLEHHMALAYGNHAEALRGVATTLGIPVLELGSPSEVAA